MFLVRRIKNSIAKLNARPLPIPNIIQNKTMYWVLNNKIPIKEKINKNAVKMERVLWSFKREAIKEPIKVVGN